LLLEKPLLQALAPALSERSLTALRRRSLHLRRRTDVHRACGLPRLLSGLLRPLCECIADTARHTLPVQERRSIVRAGAANHIWIISHQILLHKSPE
jgi:hypothetical protein